MLYKKSNTIKVYFCKRSTRAEWVPLLYYYGTINSVLLYKMQHLMIPRSHHTLVLVEHPMSKF